MKPARSILACFTLAALLTGCSADTTATASPYIEINGTAITVEVAKTEAQRVQGLSGHEPLNDGQGMLFIFEDKVPRTFWMKDMRFALDILWIEDGTIVKISSNLPPEGNEPKNRYRSDIPANYVLEVPAGWAERHHVTSGDRINYHL
jgi:uncharacterized membrane protein (UPF0127 family)